MLGGQRQAGKICLGRGAGTYPLAGSGLRLPCECKAALRQLDLLLQGCQKDVSADCLAEYVQPGLFVGQARVVARKAGYRHTLAALSAQLDDLAQRQRQLGAVNAISRCLAGQVFCFQCQRGLWPQCRL